MVCALLATAQPGGAGSELSELSEKFAFSPVGSRSYLAHPLADGTAAGEEHGAMRPIPAAGQRPAPRGNCLPQFPVCCGTTGGMVERWSFFLTSRVVLCSVCYLPRRSLAEPGPNCPNCPNEIRRGNGGAALPVFPGIKNGGDFAVAAVWRLWDLS